MSWDSQVASYMRAVLRTLVQCHAKRILHRDIKPGNFMLLEDHPLAPVKAIGIMPPLPLQIPLKHSHFKHGCVKACLHSNEVCPSFTPQHCTELAKNWCPTQGAFIESKHAERSARRFPIMSACISHNWILQTLDWQFSLSLKLCPGKILD